MRSSLLLGIDHAIRTVGAQLAIPGADAVPAGDSNGEAQPGVGVRGEAVGRGEGVPVVKSAAVLPAEADAAQGDTVQKGPGGGA